MARQLSWKRKLIYSLIRPILNGFLNLIWMTCRVKTIINDEYGQQLARSGKAIIPCYWHQQHIFGAYYMRLLQKSGLKLGFLISPSVDGEVPAKIIQSWGAYAIRGSSNRTGARAIRDLYQLIKQKGISPVNTSDGPTGPIYKFKPGAVMLAQLTQSPMLALAYAVDRAWYLKSWDKFIIPKPFSNIVIAVAKPRYVDKKVSMEEQTEIALEMENTLMSLMESASQELSIRHSGE